MRVREKLSNYADLTQRENMYYVQRQFWIVLMGNDLSKHFYHTVKTTQHSRQLCIAP